MNTVNIRVFGIVQGVFFRKSTKDIANDLGIYGWVRNDSDGSVEIMATGGREALEKFIKWCKKGPPFSRVDRVEADWLSQVEDFDSFSVI